MEHLVNVHNEPGDLLCLYSVYTRYNFVRAGSHSFSTWTYFNIYSSIQFLTGLPIYFGVSQILLKHTLYKLLSVANCNKVVVSSATSYLQDACCCSLKCNFQLLKNSQLSEETFYMLCICLGLIRIYRLSSSSSALSGNKYRRKNELWLLIRPVCFVGKFLMWWGDCSLASWCVL